ncbi:hypothetical protein SDRG_08361 [Saprolegnia diclina VS20]|uniref:Uncharacterized protein n=1 Tax=Saprolegnia diclina (strain VS20) TaxID=1156394 RepID=T0RP03_SAPDV|nr:hypothetical protein SDRG_08361 [Saprolegnia diclina VS20]EQC34153.1 hypothetical protein SDRG_08361 [Saprolegnia diclina VS20]|eukprot:XP_008612465.1 hypothetical protein SDRG_08361 [Saprolegnia diclina VS20]
MMASRVLTDPSLLRLLLAYQEGLYEDVRDRLADAMYHVRLDDDGRYYHLSNVVEPVSTTRTLFLSLPAYDFRLPLHWTIVESRLRLLTRIAACRPQLFTRDALYCAVASGDMAIVAYLCSLDLAPGRLTEPLLDLAVSHGSIALLDQLVDAGFSRASPRAAALAAELGHKDVLEYLASRSCDVTQAVATAAARGFFDILVSLHACGIRGTSPAVVDGAAMHGHANVVAYLLQNGGYTNSATAWTLAANDGHLRVLQQLHHHDAPHCSSNAMDYAATEGHLEVVMFLHSHRDEGATTDAIDGASANGHLAVVQYLCANRTEGWTHRALDDAAGGGHLEVVGFLLQWEPPAVSQRAVTQAAANGHAIVLRHLLAAPLQGVSATVAAACAAAEHGHLDALQVLYAYRQSGWNSSVWFAAFAHHDVLAFLLTHAPECVDADASLVPKTLSMPVARLLQSAFGHQLQLNLRQDYVGVLAIFPSYPWCETTMREAIRSSNVAMVRYLHEHYHDDVCDSDRLATAASVPGNTDVFLYLLQHCVRATTSEAVWIEAARYSNLAILEALHANQCVGATPAVMDEAARVGAVDVLRFLHTHRREGCSTRAMFDAITYGHWRVVAFLCRFGERGVSNEASCRNMEIAIEAFDPEWTEARLDDVLPLLQKRLAALRPS